MQNSCQVTVFALLLSPWLALFGEPAMAQTPTLLPRTILPMQDDLTRRHMSPTGKPCLTMEGYAKAQVINPNIFEHWISATNGCGQQIKLQVCYHNSQSCMPMSVPPYERRDSVLGIYPALKDFQFDVREQF